MEVKHFDWIEYIVFALTLGVSTLIGLFFCCHHGGQKTVSEYLLGNKKMPIFPIAMSLIASSISGVTLLGVPSEIYSYGAQFFMANIANVGVALATLYVFLPVFYKLQVVSLYEYLELRFDHRVRKMASLLFTLLWIMFLPIVIYGPALAFNQVSNMDIHLVAPLVCVVCIFYTTFGGLKAVVWADALQGAVMLGAILTVCITGLIKVGGIGQVFKAAQEGNRLEVFNMNPDPTARLTFWSSTVGLVFQWIAFTATSPAAIQRFVSLPTYKQARQSVVLLLLGTSTFGTLSVFMGLVIFATYKDCDPISSGVIKVQDQILPYFVLDVAGHIKGLPGLFVAGIVCAALSTMSTGLNTLSGTIYEDFVEPIFGKTTERRASNIMKVISVLVGILCTVLVNLVENMGGIVEMTSRFNGVTNGATLGIFTLGVLVPQANSTGVLVGGIVSLVVMSIIMVGSKLSGIVYEPLPTSVEQCLHNFTMVNKEYPDQSDIFPLFRVTAFVYGSLGLAIVVFVGLIVSYLTGPNKPEDVDPSLLTPFIHRFLPKSTKYASIPLKENNQQGKINNQQEKIINQQEKINNQQEKINNQQENINICDNN